MSILKPGDTIHGVVQDPNGRTFILRDEGDGTSVMIPGAISMNNEIPEGTAEMCTLEKKGDKLEVTMVVSLSGPPQVATKAFKAGWDRIFGGQRERAKA